MVDRILVVDDEIALQETLAYTLRKQGYEVQTSGEGPEALEMARRWKPDLILLDVMLPGMDGFEVCRVLRQDMNMPVLMLTARDDVIDRVVGLEVGADDYMTKPFSMRELVARVKAMLRRVRLTREEVEEEVRDQAPRPVNAPVTPSQLLASGDLVIDLTRHEARLGETLLAMKPREFDLLVFLAQHRGQVLTREFILRELWGWDYIGDSRTVDVHIRWLREKIEKNAADPQRIVTVRGAGYRFEG